MKYSLSYLWGDSNRGVPIGYVVFNAGRIKDQEYLRIKVISSFIKDTEKD